jgi:hypothetical protein
MGRLSMDTSVEHAPPTREQALARVLEYRRRSRSKPRIVQIALAILGTASLIAAVPLAVVLPEVGVPALLVGLRLLAVEVDWAARAYAWIDWRFRQAHRWFRRQSAAVRAAVFLALLALAALLVVKSRDVV